MKHHPGLGAYVCSCLQRWHELLNKKGVREMVRLYLDIVAINGACIWHLSNGCITAQNVDPTEFAACAFAATAACRTDEKLLRSHTMRSLCARCRLLCEHAVSARQTDDLAAEVLKRPSGHSEHTSILCRLLCL